MEFHIFSDKVNKQFNSMTSSQMYIADINRSEFGDAYLAAFPEGTNELFIERTEHDCQTCRQFIKFIGTAVTINDDGTVNTVWDVDGLETPYREVAAELARQVRLAPIKSIFLHNEPKVGKQHSVQLLEDGSTRKWDHFYADIPTKFYERDLATQKSKAESRQGVHLRSLEEISVNTLETVIDLLESDSVYRGAEHLPKVQSFLTLKKSYEDTTHKVPYSWLTYKQPGAGIRSSVIGSLLVDIEEGKDIEQAVKSFESKVAPSNYKRVKSVVTKKMLETAIKVIDDNDIRSALPRRQALESDVSVNDVIFADRSAYLKDRDPLMDLLEPQATSVKGLDSAPEISIEELLSTIVPNSTSLSIVTSRALAPNKVQLSAPSESTAKNILQWGNNFSWAYSGNVADSDIARNVKEVGGAIDGYLRCSLQWNESGADGDNDLDLHCRTPFGEISFSNKAVENITWPLASDIKDGTYGFFVRRYAGSNNGGFRIEIAIGSELYNYDYSTAMHSKDIAVANVHVSNGCFTIEHKLPHTQSNSGELVPVKLLMLSPNFWEGAGGKGNKHYFFLTDEEQEQEPFRGYFNEYLSPKYHDIRKSLDLLSSKMQCEVVPNGLHGYGFSSTKKTSFFIKADNRLFKVIV